MATRGPRKPFVEYEPPGKKDGKVTTLAVGEEGEGKPVTTQAVGEEGGGKPVTTLAVGEEGGSAR